MSLLVRLFLLVMVAVLPVIGIQAYGILQLRAEREAEVDAQAARLLSVVEDEKFRLVESARFILSALSEADFLRAGSWAGCQRHLESFARRAPAHRTILVADLDGRVLCSGEPAAVGTSVAGQPHVQRALGEGRFVIGERMQITGGAVLPFALPYMDENGTPAGILTVTLSLDTFSDRFAAHRLPPGASLTLADGNGTVLIAQPPGSASEGEPLPEPQRQLASNPAAGVAHLPDPQGRTRVVAYSPAGPDENLFASVSMDHAEAMRHIDHVARSGLAVAVVGLLTAVVGTWVGGTLFIRRPVEALMRAARGWTAGDSGARARLRDHGSEIGRLGSAFDAMAETLEARERALRVTNERFQTALKNSRVVVFNQDCDLRYTWIHGPALGYGVTEIIGKMDRDLFENPEDSARLEAIKRRVIETGEGTREEVGIRHKGEIFFYDLTVDPLRDARGIMVGVTCAAVDVTLHKRTETALQQAREEAERAANAKSKFLGVASHDLRQPVQSLYLFSAALAERMEGHPALPMLDRMRHALDTLKALLDGLLDMSRLESGKLEVRPAEVRLNQVLGRLVAEYEPRARQKGLTLRTIPTSAWVRTDPALLERILRNFIENALRYTDRGRILIGCRRVGAGLRVEVCDTGVGIPRDRLEDIFEEFTQINKGRTGRGLGLGLAIVKRLSSLLGHRVSVRSVVGRGSCFAVELPRVDSVADRPMPTAARPASGAASKGLILVIDDEAIILLGLKAMLEGWGFEVMTARSQEQALERLKVDGRRPQLLLADYQLQKGRTGPEALDAVQGIVGKDIPGIILTGDTAPERVREAERYGYRILYKPVLPSDLRKAMVGDAAA